MLPAGFRFHRGDGVGVSATAHRPGNLVHVSRDFKDRILLFSINKLFLLKKKKVTLSGVKDPILT